LRLGLVCGFSPIFQPGQTPHRWYVLDIRVAAQNVSRTLYIPVGDLGAGQTPSVSPPLPLPADEKSTTSRPTSGEQSSRSTAHGRHGVLQRLRRPRRMESGHHRIPCTSALSAAEELERQRRASDAVRIHGSYRYLRRHSCGANRGTTGICNRRAPAARRRALSIHRHAP
jgi:hypothetical protein